MRSVINQVRFRAWAFGVFALCLAVSYASPIRRLLHYAAARDLYSHLFLVPFISLYLAYQQRSALRPNDSRPSVKEAGLVSAAGAAALWLHASMLRAGYDLAAVDGLSLILFSFLCFFVGGFLLFLGRGLFRSLAFPLLFLLFLVPMPTLVEEAFETVSQVGSAYAFAGLLALTRTPFLRDGMVFRVPGLTLEVASQCSGIRSSLVLFITGLLAGHLFLRTGWRKLVMAVVFFPIGLLRNGARILTITLLTLHVDPRMMEGPVHRRGGPPFFVLSLIPLFVILFLLKKTERENPCQQDASGGNR